MGSLCVVVTGWWWWWWWCWFFFVLSVGRRRCGEERWVRRGWLGQWLEGGGIGRAVVVSEARLRAESVGWVKRRAAVAWRWCGRGTMDVPLAIAGLRRPLALPGPSEPVPCLFLAAASSMAAPPRVADLAQPLPLSPLYAAAPATPTVEIHRGGQGGGRPDRTHTGHALPSSSSSSSSSCTICRVTYNMQRPDKCGAVRTHTHTHTHTHSVHVYWRRPDAAGRPCGLRATKK
jgi:hypothetical protein